uniref:AAA+ ATPase domain-containing protein n=1 Tax=Astyanax mexicanus TaxID=7994 RepID=A0A3B1IM44_ASTMX
LPIVPKPRPYGLLHTGTPARYRLFTTRSNLDESGKIRKWTFGQREINTQNKIILLVGETGTGKTTLINAIVNYTLGVKLNDVWFDITEAAQNQTEDQSKSQTTEITVYEVFIQNNPISVVLIDTPGYGDTRGLEHDEMIAENLRKLFENDTGVKEIDAVCLVVKASQNRLSEKEVYVFDAVLSLFGKDIEKNIVIFATHSDGSPPVNAINAIKKAGIPSEQKMTVGQRVYRFAWELTEDNLNYFFAVLTEQIQLKACVSNLRERIEIKEHKHEELTQIQDALKENQKKIQKNEDFSFTVTKTHKEKVTIENASWWGKMATCCSVGKENCHESNYWGSINSAWCEVMKDGHCTVCTGKCHHSKHIRENKKYVMNSEVVKMTFTDMITQYHTPENYAKISLDSDQFKDVREKLENTKKKRWKRSITLKPDSAFIVETLDFLIPRAEEAEYPEWVQELKRLREIQPEAEERASSVQRYCRAGLKKVTSFLSGRK